MTALVDLRGKRFGMLLVQEHDGRDTTGKTRWHCACDCGGTKSVTALNLKSGNTKSCGCLKSRSGANNPRTITDPSRIKERKRSFAAQRAWRQGVLRRDPRCIKCGSTSNLHAHHLVGYADEPSKREQSDNGATLCANCHVEFHVEYGRRTGFTVEDFCEFVASIREMPPVFDEPIPLCEVTDQIIKYVTRWRSKGGIADLNKAKHYIDLLIELEQREDDGK